MPTTAENRAKPACSREDAVVVLRRLRDAGHVTYFAGGCMRDLLLGLEAKDYDIVTDGGDADTVGTLTTGARTWTSSGIFAAPVPHEV